MREPTKRSRELRVDPEEPVLVSRQRVASESQRLVFALSLEASQLQPWLSLHLLTRPLPDGRVLHVDRLWGARVQLALAADGDARTDDYLACYIYECLSCAVSAALTWNGIGEPFGWVRCTEWSQLPRRRPGGDARREFVAP